MHARPPINGGPLQRRGPASGPRSPFDGVQLGWRGGGERAGGKNAMALSSTGALQQRRPRATAAAVACKRPSSHTDATPE